MFDLLRSKLFQTSNRSRGGFWQCTEDLLNRFLKATWASCYSEEWLCYCINSSSCKNDFVAF